MAKRGPAELAAEVTSFAQPDLTYLDATNKFGLTQWMEESHNYGRVALFVRYLQTQYAPEGRLQDLVNGPERGIAAIDEFLAGRRSMKSPFVPADADFNSVFANWMVANRLNWEDGGDRR